MTPGRTGGGRAGGIVGNGDRILLGKRIIQMVRLVDVNATDVWILRSVCWVSDVHVEFRGAVAIGNVVYSCAVQGKVWAFYMCCVRGDLYS